MNVDARMFIAIGGCVALFGAGFTYLMVNLAQVVEPAQTETQRKADRYFIFLAKLFLFIGIVALLGSLWPW